MAKASLNDEERTRLGTAVRQSHYVLKDVRTQRLLAIQQYVGAHYSIDGSPVIVPVNMIAAYVTIVGKSLVSKHPQAMISTFEKEMKPLVSAMQEWMNTHTKSMGFKDALYRIVISALFPGCGGIAKVALATPSDSAARGWGLKTGEVFVEEVSCDDFAYDIHAKKYSEASWIAHRYRVPLDTITDDKLYHRARKQLTADNDDIFNKAGDEKADIVGKSTVGKTSLGYEDMITLWEIYLPRKKRVITIWDGDLEGSNPPLRDIEWIGPPTGPYHFLGLGPPVPDNPRPTSPIENLIDIHLAINNTWRKMLRQSERLKKLLLARSADGADVDRVRNANDGDVVKFDGDVAGLKEVILGGTDQILEAMARILTDMFNQQAGNLALLGGTAHQSPTAAQDKMLNENSSRQVSDMQDTVVDFTTEIYEAMGWYYWHDPFRVMKTNYKLPGIPDKSITRTVTPQQRQAVDWDDAKIVVDPYSMQHSTPQQRGQQLLQMVQMTIAPMMGLLKEQGTELDMNAFMAKMAVYMNMPDLPDIINTVEPPVTEDGGGASGQSGGAGQDGAPMPASTTRNYVRESRSQQTAGGQAANAMAQAVGQQRQKSTGGVR